MKKIIATNIETDLWYSIIKNLRNRDWRTTYSYSLFDKGIDYDKYVLRKGSKKIILIWDNWSGGEIKAKEKDLLDIQKSNKVIFEYEDPVHFISLLEKLKNLFKFFGRK